MAARIRSGLPLLHRILRSDSLSAQRSAIQRSVLTPAFTASENSKNFSTSYVQKEEKIKILRIEMLPQTLHLLLENLRNGRRLLPIVKL